MRQRAPTEARKLSAGNPKQPQWRKARAAAAWRDMRDRAHAAWQRAQFRVAQLWSSPRGMLYRERAARVRAHPLSGWVVLVGGTAFMTLLVAAIDQVLVPLPNPGIVYLPFIAMIAYY